MTKKKSKKVNSKNKSNKDPYFIEENFDYLLKEVNKDKNLFLPGGPLKSLTMAGLPAATLPQASIPNQIAITPEMQALFNKTTANAAKGLKAAGTATSVLGAAVDTAQMVKGAIDLSKTNDMSHVDAQANALANTEFNGSSYLDLSNQVSNQIEVDDVSMEDLEGTAKDNWKQAGKVALKGASAGAAIGSIIPGVGTAIGTGVGAGIGALVGGISAGIGRLTKRKKAKNELEEYEEQKERAEREARQNLMSGIDSMISQNVQNEAAEFYALGGPMHKEFSNGVTIINEGGSHSTNPNEGVQVGIDPEGIPNLVEEGEVIFNDYVFSNRLTVPNKVRNKYKLRNNKDLSFADAAKDIQKMSEEMPNDPIVKRTMELKMSQLIQEQEMVRQKKNKNNSFSKGGKLNKYGLGEWLKKGAKWAYNNGDTLMQTAPVFGSLLAVGNDIFGGNEPDYTNVKDYERAVKDAYNPIKAETLNDYIDYKPYDPFYELNKLEATQAASIRALLNASQGNPTIARAMMLASDYNYGNQIGDTYRKALEFNDTRQRQAAEFNRGTRQFNAQAINAANQFNAQQAANKATALGQVAQWKDQIYNANRAEKSANLTGLYEGIAGLGETFMNLKDRRWLMDKGILVGPDGKMVKITSQGGKIKRIKNKRRLS